MLNIQLARKYSRAMFEIAEEEGKLEDYGKELTGIKKDFDSSPELKSFLANPQVEVKGKKSLLGKLFSGEVSEVVLNFLYLLADKRRLTLFDAIESEYRALSNEARGIVVADVTTAGKMTDAQLTKMKDKLAAVTGKKIELREHEDKRLIGGAVVKIGDKRIDGSVAGRLSKLTAKLLSKQ